MAPRVALAALMQEGNSFSPIPTTLETFAATHLLRGAEIAGRLAGTDTEIGGALAVLAAAGAEAVPLVSACVTAGGPVTRAAFDALAGEIAERLRAAGRVDGLFLALHGALVVEDGEDGEGELIARLRALLPRRVPIAVTLDLHGHITPAMLVPGVFHLAYRCYPHTDVAATGARCARRLLDVIAGAPIPRMALAKRPMIVSPTVARTTDGPFAEVAAAARAMEASGRVLEAGLFPVQPWLDVADLGFAALVAAPTPAEAAEAAEELCALMWARRNDFAPDLVPLGQAIATGLAGPGLTVVSDAGDAPTGGAAADSPAVLEALLAAGAERAGRPVLLALCDPPAAAAAHAAGVGAELALALGHAFHPGRPGVRVTARVLSLSEGQAQPGTAGAAGAAIATGPTAVLAVGDLRIVVRSLPAAEWDRALFDSQGLDPAAAALVFVKSPGHFRASFAPLAARILIADTPGPTAPDMRRIPFRRVTRPLHPLDPI